MKLRPASNADSAAIVEIVNEAFRKVGDQVWLEGCDKDLSDVEGSYSQKGGAFVVLEKEGDIIGTHATIPVDPNHGLLTFRRLYLKTEYHGSEASRILFQWALDWAMEQTFKRVEFWSDVRFTRAHAFFKKFGFINTGEIRHMNDAQLPYSEYRFFLDLPSGE